jgi:hypothetical protein
VLGKMHAADTVTGKIYSASNIITTTIIMIIIIVVIIIVIDINIIILNLFSLLVMRWQSSGQLTAQKGITSIYTSTFMNDVCSAH